MRWFPKLLNDIFHHTTHLNMKQFLKKEKNNNVSATDRFENIYFDSWLHILLISSIFHSKSISTSLSIALKIYAYFFLSHWMSEEKSYKHNPSWVMSLLFGDLHLLLISLRCLLYWCRQIPILYRILYCKKEEVCKRAIKS